jgi:hypothetical protein
MPDKALEFKGVFGSGRGAPPGTDGPDEKPFREAEDFRGMIGPDTQRRKPSWIPT